MRPSMALLMLVVSSAIGRSALLQGECAASDAAPDAIAIHSEPRRGAPTMHTISGENANTLVRVDALSTRGGDWLKVRLSGFEGWVSAADLTCRLSPADARSRVSALAASVLQALKSRNMQTLAVTVHPVKGLRFSPFGTIDAKSDRVLTAAQLKTALDNGTRQVWGHDDASGAPIRLSFSSYYGKFVYDRDFARARDVTYNRDDDGNRKVWDQYPNAIVVDYPLPETATGPQEHLRLAFEEQGGKWYLSGIIHDGWTI